MAASAKDVGGTQEQLLTLLRLSPKLTSVVTRDPSLLANQDYISHNNPELAQFLESHPEIARNPDFYLFTNLGDGGGGRERALERKIWPETQGGGDVSGDMMRTLTSLLVFVGVLSALIWLIRVLLENRRWSRTFKLQAEVHGKLIDKFGSNQELLAYMNTAPGKRFLEAAPIPVDFERDQRLPSPVARVLTSLQLGVVLIVLDLGVLFLRHRVPLGPFPLLVIGTLGLMLGLGLVVSAGITWLLARRLGLLPRTTDADAEISPLQQARERP